MAWIQRSILGLIGCLMVIGVRNVAGAGDTPAPYIYYYANTINAIVVERADGTDSRVIAPGAMPADNRDNVGIDNLDWSPSGEWMAWRSATVIENHADAVSGWIARSDGSQRLTLLDDMGGDILNMQWSPTSDLLFVAHAAERRQLQLMIIDPAANQIIAETTYESQSWILVDYEVDSGWLANGEGVYFGAEAYPSYLLTRLTINNVVQTTLYEELPVPNEKFPTSQVIDLQQGRLLYFKERDDKQYDAVLEDLQTGNQIVIDEAADLQTYYKVYWNPSLTYALIVRENCPTNACTSAPLHLLDARTDVLKPLGDTIAVMGDEPDLEGVTMWSSVGNSLIAADTSIPSLVVIDTATLKATPLPASIYWGWSDSETLFLFNNQTKVIYRYDTRTNQIETFDVLPEGNYYSIWPAPNDMLIGVYNTLPHQGNIVNLNTGKALTWPPHSFGTYGAIFATYTWSADSQWFFSNEHISFAGGGGGPEARTIINLDGTVRRELGVCFCAYGFVPDRALPYLGAGSPTSVIQQPEYSLPHEGKVTGVAWSPDGSQLASYSLTSEYGEAGKVTIWDVSHSPELLSSIQTNFPCASFRSPCKMIWSLDSSKITLTNYDKVEMLDIETRQRVDRTIPVSGFSLTSSDGQTQFVENGNGTISVNRPGTEKPTTITSTFASLDSADVRPDGKYIFGASFSHHIYVWDATTGAQLTDLNWYALGVALSPDGTRLAAAGSSLVTIWDVSDLSKKGQ